MNQHILPAFCFLVCLWPGSACTPAHQQQAVDYARVAGDTKAQLCYWASVMPRTPELADVKDGALKACAVADSSVKDVVRATGTCE